MIEFLHTPEFARLCDYLGIWSMEPTAFGSLWDIAAAMDLAAHISQPHEHLKAAMEKMAGPGGKSIAVVKLIGLLMKGQSSMGGTSTIQARRDIRQAASDPEIAGILLAIDSPGGTVAGTSDLAAEVAAARKQKPVYAHIDDLGASAAYWVASQADKISANSATALVGSIGTLQVVHDRSGQAEKEGIRTLVFSTGHLKGMGAPGSKITDEQSVHIQGLVDNVQKSFDAAVQKGRGMNAKELTGVRHGGVMTAHEALSARLIDAVQPLGKTIADLQQAAKERGMNAGVDLHDAVESLANDLNAQYAIDLASTDLLAFTHNSDTADSEPDWSAVDKTALPMLAFADHGDGKNKSSFKYPHHWVQNAGGKDDNGVWTTGTLLLHKSGLNAAWSAAQGGRSGQKAPAAVIDHLEAHRKALGLDKPTNLTSIPLLKLAVLPVLSASETST